MTRYGIRITLPKNSTLATEHLFGAGWESFRWYDSLAAREHALREMLRPLSNYRKGDHPAPVLERVERSD
jgi:hypothetical protein